MPTAAAPRPASSVATGESYQLLEKDIKFAEQRGEATVTHGNSEKESMRTHEDSGEKEALARSSSLISKYLRFFPLFRAFRVGPV